MSTDLDIIKQLEQTIGKKLTLTNWDEVYWSGYQLICQQQVILVDLTYCEQSYSPK